MNRFGGLEKRGNFGEITNLIMDNILIDHLFLSLSALMQLDDDGYRQIFEEDIKSGYFHSGYRDAINSLLCQESFDWKHFFKEQNFYQYDEQKLEKNC